MYPTGAKFVQSMNQDASIECDQPDNSKRFDCFPGQLADEKSCEARGCCWKPVLIKDKFIDYVIRLERPINVPFCFFPTNYNGYHLSDIHDTSVGKSALLNRKTKSGWPKDINVLQVDVFYESSTRLRIKVRLFSISF